MDQAPVTSRREGSFAVLTLCQPDRRNPLSQPTLVALRKGLEEAGQSDARGVIVAALGPVFSAGHDYRDLAERDLEGTRDLLGLCRETMDTIQHLDQPVIAQVEGSPRRVAASWSPVATSPSPAPSVRFAVPGGRGGWFCTTPGVALARAVGRKHALEMLLTGEPIDAATAMAWGLVNRVVPDDTVARETRALLTKATRGSRQSKATGKRAFYQQVDLDTQSAYDLATDVMASSSQTPDAREGIEAFLEKRRPDFTER